MDRSARKERRVLRTYKTSDGLPPETRSLQFFFFKVGLTEHGKKLPGVNVTTIKEG